MYKCLVINGEKLEWIECPIDDWQEYRKVYPYHAKIPTIQQAKETLAKITYAKTLQD